MASDSKKCIIIANGQRPRKGAVNYLFSVGYKTLICADGGANSAFRLKLQPDYIVGDLDSINKEVYQHYDKTDCEIIKYDRQNDTDVEKALKLAIRNRYKEVILLGATGDRLDHSFCNLGIALKFDDKIKVTILHEKSFLKVYSGEVKLNTVKGETISTYGFDDKTKITSQGLKYPLKNTDLPFGQRESTSNVALGDEVSLKIKGGKVFIIREFKKLKENGFFS